MASYGRGSFDGFDSYQGGAGARDSAGSDFTSLSQKIAQNIQKITQNVTLVKNLVAQIGTPQDSEEVRTRVEQTIHYTNQLHKETSSKLKELSQLHLPPSTPEHRQWKMQKERFTEEFSNLLKSFQAVQRDAVDKMRASVRRARAQSGIYQPPFQDDYEKQTEMATPGYSQTREVLQMEQDVDLESLQEREDAIRKLENDISDVNTIFKDLGMLVHQQGETLDSIEANIDSAQMSVQEGTSQLSKAMEYQQKSRRKMCIIIVIVLVIVGILALIIWGATR
ncbi:syntaxin-7-like [Babylonia areolata]|uniref:syntaxin-7-like n=1 Tax=Babylonia areolata TaxID=304850 RepID=UPI003FD0F90C